MKAVAGVPGLAVLGVALGASLLFGASAAAKTVPELPRARPRPGSHAEPRTSPAGVGKTTPAAKTGAGKSARTSPAAGMPAKIRAELLKDALGIHRARSSSHPYDIQAVRTISGKVSFLESLLPARTPIYLIALRGHFSGHRAGEGGPIPARCEKGPAETEKARCPASVLEVAVSESLKVVAFRRSSSYPNLEALGTPVHLAAGKRK